MKKVEVAILSYKKYNVNVFYIFVLLTDPSFLCLAVWCQTRIPCTQQGWPTKHLNNGRPFTLVYVSSFALKISNKTNPKHKTGLSVGKFSSSCSTLQAHNYIRTCSMQGGGHFFSQETCLVRYANEHFCTSLYKYLHLIMTTHSVLLIGFSDVTCCLFT